MVNFREGSKLVWQKVDCSEYQYIRKPRFVIHLRPNSHVQKMVTNYTQQLELSLNKVIGSFSTEIESRFCEIRTRETNIGYSVNFLNRFCSGLTFAI